VNAGRACALAGLGLVVLAAACGRKGNPLPPLRPEPGHITDTRLRRIDDRVELRFTIPAANADGTTPSVLDRVEVYAMATPASAPAPTTAQLIDPSHLKGRIEIRHEKAAAKAMPGAPPDPRPAPGDATMFIDRAGTDRHGEDAPVLHYIVVGVSGKTHKGVAAGPFDVALAASPPVPQRLAFTYDEQTLTLTWQPAASGQLFRVYDVDADDAALTGPVSLRPTSTATTFAAPVEFGRSRCLMVRAVQEMGPSIIEGPAAGRACVTPVDTFPPPAPTGLLAIPGEGSVELTWEAVTAKDLAGYVVLRGDGSGDRLLPLTKVMPDAHYTDRTATRGLTYSYAVLAEDARGNASGPSNRQRVIARLP
jgi:hypothetical protein